MPGMVKMVSIRMLPPSSEANCRPVTVITGHGNETLAIDAIRAGVVDFLKKPVRMDDLLAAHAFYEGAGWLTDPAGYHRTPPPVDDFESRAGKSFAGPRRMKYEHVRFPSGWAPHEGEPGRDRWLAHPLNGISHVYVLEHVHGRSAAALGAFTRAPSPLKVLLQEVRKISGVSHIETLTVLKIRKEDWRYSALAE